MQRLIQKPVERQASEEQLHPRLMISGANDQNTYWGRKAVPPSGLGKVTLVGAGPGDPELLTIKAVRALQSADVILFDDLVSDDVLEFAKKEAKRMLVGKRGGRTSCRQEDINDLMVMLAKQGKHVVRLKSGDPMIFGRAGEEIQRLEKEGVPVKVVAGVTSGMALASELGVSLTHRDKAHSVRFITGHSRKGRLPEDLDWQGIADPETTLIFYMGGRTCAEIAKRLISHGLCPTTPVVVAANVSRANSERQFTTLAGLNLPGLHVPTSQPVLIGVGSVFEPRNENLSTNAAPVRQLHRAAVV